MGKEVCVPSKYKGVYSRDGGKKWRAYIDVDGKRVQLSAYDTEELAAKAVDRALCVATGDASGRNLGPLSEEEAEALRGTTLAVFIAAAQEATAKHAKGTSGYKGVCWQCVLHFTFSWLLSRARSKDTKKWGARIMSDGKEKWLGLFVDAIEAAEAYDMCVSLLISRQASLTTPTGPPSRATAPRPS
jgi:hypothetical protein